MKRFINSLALFVASLFIASLGTSSVVAVGGSGCVAPSTAAPSSELLARADYSTSKDGSNYFGFKSNLADSTEQYVVLDIDGKTVNFGLTDLDPAAGVPVATWYAEVVGATDLAHARDNTDDVGLMGTKDNSSDLRIEYTGTADDRIESAHVRWVSTESIGGLDGDWFEFGIGNGRILGEMWIERAGSAEASIGGDFSFVAENPYYASLTNQQDMVFTDQIGFSSFDFNEMWLTSDDLTTMPYLSYGGFENVDFDAKTPSAVTVIAGGSIERCTPEGYFNVYSVQEFLYMPYLQHIDSSYAACYDYEAGGGGKGFAEDTTICYWKYRYVMDDSSGLLTDDVEYYNWGTGDYEDAGEELNPEGEITLDIGSSEDGEDLKVADIDIDLTNLPGVLDLSSGSDKVNGVSFVHEEGNLLSGVTFTLYIPMPDGDNSEEVRICPGASSFDEVTEDCVGGYTLGIDDPRVSLVTIDGQDYFAVTGVSGTGGMVLGTSTEELAATGIETNISVTAAIAMIMISVGLAKADIRL